MLRANDPTSGFLKAWRTYVPKRYAKSVVFFRTQDRGPEYDRDPSMGWGACVMGDIQIHIVPGGHLDMMSMPAVGVIAEKLATYLGHGANYRPSELNDPPDGEPSSQNRSLKQIKHPLPDL